MTPCGKTYKIVEATWPSTLLSTKHINLGTWNVITMYQTGTTAQIAAEMIHYTLALLGISETRWTKTYRTKWNNYRRANTLLWTRRR
jgi:hypothetical protein